MKNLLTVDYWMNLAPVPLIPVAQKMFVAFIIILAAAALAIAMHKSKAGIYRGFFKRLYSFCLGNAIIGLIFLFFNYERVPFFSARFWLGIWALSMIAWIIPILKGLKEIPKKKAAREQEQEFKKYLPK